MPQIAFESPSRYSQREFYPLTLCDEIGHVRNLRAIEGDVIRLAIVVYRGNMTEIPRHLRIGRSTLYRKLWELGITLTPLEV